MSRQFNRRCRVTVGFGTEGIEVEGLRIQFTVEKSVVGGKPGAATIQLYNLSVDTRERMSEHAKSVRLVAGYGDVVREIFQGQIRHVVSQHEGTEWITTLYCWDGYRALQESTATLSYAAGTSYEFILRDLAGTFGDPPLDIVGLDSYPTTLNTVAITGASKQAMDSLAVTLGFDWGFNNGRLEVSGHDSAFDDAAVVLSSATGMLESPVVTDMGIELKCLLNPAIQIRRRIVIESVGAGVKVGQIENRLSVPELHAGTYTVGETVHEGDTWGNDWTTSIRTFRPGVGL